MTDTTGYQPRLATARDRSTAVDVLTRAFGDDPLFEHLLPASTPRREGRLRRLFRLEAARSQRRGGLWVAGDAGVLLCFPPGRFEPTAWENLYEAPQWRYIFGRRIAIAAAAIDRMQDEQRSLPDHWFVCYAAVDPTKHNHGIGTSLMQALLDECDRTGTPAYTEASNDKSHVLAAQRGFVDRGSIELPDGGPVVHGMWRDPA